MEKCPIPYKQCSIGRGEEEVIKGRGVKFPRKLIFLE
jgi:hypothetical protein